MDLTQLYRRGFIYRLHFDFKFSHFSYTIVQIVEHRLGIVVVTSIPERIIGSNCRSTTVVVFYGTIAPRIVGVGDQLSVTRVIYSNDVTLQIFLKPVGIEHSFGIGRSPVLHTNGRTLSIIEVQKDIVAPLFCNDLRPIEAVGVYNTVDCLTGSDSFVVVFEGEVVLYFGGTVGCYSEI